MKGKYLFGTLSATVMMMGVVGSTMATATASAAKPVTITWYTEPINNTGTRKELINVFEKQYPNIKIKLVTGPTDVDTVRTILSTTISGGASTPDVYFGDIIWPAEFGQDGLAMNLSKEFPSSFWSRFAPGLLPSVTVQGQKYAAPFYMETGFLYYRKDLLAKAHLPVPKTWAQLEKESRALIKQHSVKYGYVWQGDSYEGLTCDWVEMLADAGGSVFNSSFTQSTINSPQALKALNTLKGFITSGISPQAVTTFQEPQALNVFDTGNSAFMRGWAYAWGIVNNTQSSKVAGKVGMVPLPAFSENQYPGNSALGGAVLYVNPHSTHTAQDLKFINWLTGAKAQEILAKHQMLPTNYAVQKNRKVIAMSQPLALVHDVRIIVRPAGTANYPSVSKAMYSNLNSALSGSISASQALQNMDKQLNQAVSKNSL